MRPIDADALKESLAGNREIKTGRLLSELPH